MTSSLSVTSNIMKYCQKGNNISLYHKSQVLYHREAFSILAKRKRLFLKETRPFLPAHLKGESFVISGRDALSLMHSKDNSTFSVHHIGPFA